MTSTKSSISLTNSSSSVSLRIFSNSCIAVIASDFFTDILKLLFNLQKQQGNISAFSLPFQTQLIACELGRFSHQ
eukprot:m.15920 g.15920  ORF g.15920 m.15920 type:complete len:75 (-) comp4545_c0_seq2:80-304(-)